ncbi:hypothetical protein FRACYDRAFT_250927 [Fragilariopsis cylindrus CCMP1102]|uniref:Uncharacterized protein n=1 Tax=Fragilariopsis cylindrus CCMP1102 TaxID=635003 RepID=A0A1E7EP11_9STRA|nr:hypothetical protein FRACYDRAFT_250927 [Fragilariopsis cylindrus CCMP1102]|eukprot:OEU07507.1 hypothetical protein FRACYDRAFT_250927 [Fragilariopsis cylindrus CCMP1102]
MAIVNRFNQLLSETECKDKICNEKITCNEFNNMEKKNEYLEKEPTILPTTRRILQEKQKIQSVENPEKQSRESTKSVKTTPTNTIEKLPNSESEMKTHVCKVSTNPQCGQEPTNTIEDSLTKTRGNGNKQNSNTQHILNNHESGNEQKIDTRLIINTKSTRTEEQCMRQEHISSTQLNIDTTRARHIKAWSARLKQHQIFQSLQQTSLPRTRRPTA